MIELILAVSIASTTTMPPPPPVTTPLPQPVYTPPPKSIYTPPPSPSSGESWRDKMWRRYKENSK